MLLPQQQGYLAFPSYVSTASMQVLWLDQAEGGQAMV
jgi:hypothetical protein